MVMFSPTWDDVMTLVGLEHGRVLSADDMRFLLWECTAYPMASVSHIQTQLHEALTEPRIDRCHCCGTPKADCDRPCCRDCYHPGNEWGERLGGGA